MCRSSSRAPRWARFVQLGFSLFAFLLVPGGLSAQGGDYEPIRPIASRADSVGMVDQIPLVQINEFTGNVTLDLSVGVEGLVLPIRFNSQPATGNLYYGLPFAKSWNIGYGMIGAKRPVPVEEQQIHPNARPIELDKVLYRGPGGVETEFKPDYLFQRPPQEPGWYHYHFIDADLRRITRTIDPKNPEAITDGDFWLLDRDGGRTTFQPRHRLGGVPSGGVFYPVEIEGANGRKLFLSYGDHEGAFPGGGLVDDPALGTSQRPLLEFITDEWGRSLQLKYRLLADGDVALETVWLKAPGQNDQLLVTFAYQGAYHRPTKMITPEGHETSFTWGRPLPNRPIQLTKVELPTGGAVLLDYQVVTEPICPYTYFETNEQRIRMDENRPRVRIKTVTFAGDTYIYEHRPGRDYGIDHDGSWVVHVKSFAGAGDGRNFERLTQYHKEYTNAETTNYSWCSPPIAMPTWKAELSGQPIRRLESYGGPPGSIVPASRGNFTFTEGGSHRRQEWSYTSFAVRDPSNGGDVLRADVKIDKPLVTVYWTDRDAGKWWSEFRYEQLLGPAYDQVTKTRSKRWPTGWETSEQNFAYESRVRTDHGNETSIANDPHVIGLVRQAETTWEIDDVRHPVARQAFDFEPGRHPLPIRRDVFTSNTSFQTVEMDYYPTGHTWAGLLHTSDRVPSSSQFEGQRLRTTYEGYQFGQPSRVQPPAGPPIVRSINPDGTIASEEKDGVTVRHGYDDDRRPELRSFPGSGQHDEITDYARPGDPQTVTMIVGGRTLTVESVDPWGRPSTETTFHDHATSGTKTTVHGPIGLIDHESLPSGAFVRYTYDVLGRNVSIDTREGTLSGPRLSYSGFQYRALGYSGDYAFRETETLYDPTMTYATKREKVTDFFGRTIRAATEADCRAPEIVCEDPDPETLTERHQTEFHYHFVDGLERTLVQPEGGTPRASDHLPRLTETDWLGRVTLECHPEHRCFVDPATFEPIPDPATGLVNTVTHRYDSLGRLVQTDGPGEESIALHHDALDRVVRRVDRRGDALFETGRYTYDVTNNRLEEAITQTGAEPVIRRFDAFDALQRPLETTVTIPSAHAAPFELEPAGYWLYGEAIPFVWSADRVPDRFVVELQRLPQNPPPGTPVAPILTFEALEESFEVTASAVTAAVAALDDPAAGQPYLGNLDADPDFVLDPSEDLEYRWRVYGWNGDEPTLASAWVTLDRPIGPDDCHFKHFRVRDGVGEGALVEWQALNCPEGGPYSVAIRTSAEHPDPSCALDDVLFSTDKNGPRRALFMVTGWDMVDGAPAIPANPNAPQCTGVDTASFRGVIADLDGNEVHSVGPLTGRALPAGTCDVRNVNVIDGLNGTVPVVRWETQDCEDHTVDVIAEAEIPDSAPDPPSCRHVGRIGGGPSGQIEARFMVDGYTDLSGATCGAVDYAWFSVRVTAPDNSVFETTPIPGFVEPVGGFVDGCYTRLFTEASAPGVTPIIAWEARGCEGLEAELTYTSVGRPSNLACVVRRMPWQDALFGVRDARFMAEGYEGSDGSWCDPVADLLSGDRDQVEFDFDFNLVDPTTGLYAEPQWRIKKTVRAKYELPPPSTSTGPCRIDFFKLVNGFFNGVPTANWSTSGHCEEVRLLAWTDAHVAPPCQLEGNVWSRLPHGPVALSFMVDGYDQGLSDDRDGTFDCRGEPGGNGSYGQALQRAFFRLEAVASDGSVVSQPTGPPDVVINHNDQSQSSQPGPDDPCSVVDFWIDQSPVPGMQQTDSLPLVRWTTTCPRDSRYDVRVLMHAQSVDRRAQCRLQDHVLAAAPNGPETAELLATGWWDFVNGTTVCHAREAEIRIEIVDSVTGQPVPGETHGPVEVVYSGPFLLDEPPVSSCRDSGTCTNGGCSDPEISFAGFIETPSSDIDCVADLAWHPAVSSCGHDVTYTVWRGSFPSPSSAGMYGVMPEWTGTTFADTTIDSGTYYYLISARDDVTGLVHEAGPALRLDNGCTGNGGGGPRFWIEPSSIEAGQSATLHWDLPGAEDAFLVGFGTFPPVGQQVVSPTATTTYQIHGNYGGAQTAYSTEVEVTGGTTATPAAGDPCDRPCSESVLIGGEEHFCRGFGFWDGDFRVDFDPIWLTMADWEQHVLENGNPVSPFCLRAVCGSGDLPPNRWHAPEEVPHAWHDSAAIASRVEFAGDGWDNDCDTDIDENN